MIVFLKIVFFFVNNATIKKKTKQKKKLKLLLRIRTLHIIKDLKKKPR